MTTFEEAIEKAASNLTLVQQGNANTYGGSGSRLEIAQAWTELARVIALKEAQDDETT